MSHQQESWFLPTRLGKDYQLMMACSALAQCTADSLDIGALMMGD